MGYKARRKTYQLIFEDPIYDGLEVLAHSASTERFIWMSELASYKVSVPPSKKDLERVRELFSAFAEVLVSWNLEDDDGNPIKPTVESLMAQDFDWSNGLVQAWIDAIGGVSPPLGTPSSGGDPSVEASIPMEVSLPSR